MLDVITVEALRVGPERIRLAASSAVLARQALDRQRRDVKRAEALVALAVSGETVTTLDEKVKPKFSNAEARAAETARRLAAEPEYVRLAAQAEALEAEVERLSIELLFEQDCFKSARAVAQLLGGEAR